MKKMRLAFFTPLNPVRSGISDYSEELLPHLGELAAIEIVTGPYQPANDEIVKRFPVIQVPEFLRRRSSYDCIIYQVGNNFPAHGYMLPCLAVAPGIVVLHDYSLTYLMLPLTLQQGEWRTLQEILKPSYGRGARSVSLRLMLGLMDPYEVSLARPVIEMSRAVIVHNLYSLRKLKSDFPEKRFQHIPHATPIREPRQDAASLRSAYRIREDEFVFASVSSLAYNKRLELVLRAVGELRRKFPQIKFVMVGQGDLGSRARGLIRRLGLEQSVLQTGWVSSQEYLDYIDLADVVVDLRYPTAGETSGSSLRAMQAAKPLVVSLEGSFRELPDSCCIRLPTDGQEVEMLHKALADLLQDPEKRRRMGMAGREFVLAHLHLEQAASSYLEFAREVALSSYQPTRIWNFPELGEPTVRSRFVIYAYKAGRLAYYYRRYGLSGTWKRIQSGLHSSSF